MSKSHDRTIQAVSTTGWRLRVFVASSEDVADRYGETGIREPHLGHFVAVISSSPYTESVPNRLEVQHIFRNLSPAQTYSLELFHDKSWRSSDETPLLGERGIDKRRRDHSNVNQVFGAWLRKTDFREYFNYTVEIVTSMWYGGEHVSNNPYLAGHMKRLGTLHDDSAKLSPYRTRSLGTPSIIQRKERDCFAV